MYVLHPTPKLYEFNIMPKGIDDIRDIGRAMALVADLPLMVDGNGFDFGNLELRHLPRNPSFFVLSPGMSRVRYTGIENIDYNIFEVCFARAGFEIGDIPNTYVDELLVQYKREPRTGIFLRTSPFLEFT